MGGINELVVTLLGEGIEIQLEPSIQKKCIIRTYEEIGLFLKLLKMVVSASENISPLRQCYITTPSNNKPPEL